MDFRRTVCPTVCYAEQVGMRTRGAMAGSDPIAVVRLGLPALINAPFESYLDFDLTGAVCGPSAVRCIGSNSGR